MKIAIFINKNDEILPILAEINETFEIIIMLVEQTIYIFSKFIIYVNFFYTYNKTQVFLINYCE